MRKYIAFAAATLMLALVPMSHAQGKGNNQILFTLNGFGTITNPGTPGCQNTPEGCTISETGSFTSNLGDGTWDATLHIDWAHATSNNQGGFCAPADGTGTLQFTADGSLSVAISGQVCEVGPTGLNVPHFLTAFFRVISGSGGLLGAGGSGVLSATDNGLGAVRINMNGILGACSGKGC